MKFFFPRIEEEEKEDDFFSLSTFMRGLPKLQNKIQFRIVGTDCRSYGPNGLYSEALTTEIMNFLYFGEKQKKIFSYSYYLENRKRRYFFSLSTPLRGLPKF